MKRILSLLCLFAATPAVQADEGIAYPTASFSDSSSETFNLSRPSASPAADGAYRQGRTAFGHGDYAGALGKFRESRRTDPNYMAPWFYEIRTLRMLHRPDEEKKTTAELLQTHPKLKKMKMFKEWKP